jgi:hypothetical protein
MGLGLLDLALERVQTVCQLLDIAIVGQLAALQLQSSKQRTLCWDRASSAAC